MNVLQSAPTFAFRPIERRACQAIVVLLVALVGAYIYCTGAMVLYAVGGQDSSRTSQDVASHIAALEMEYFSLVNTLTVERASNLGLAPLDDKHFVTRASRLGTAHGMMGN